LREQKQYEDHAAGFRKRPDLNAEIKEIKTQAAEALTCRRQHPALTDPEVLQTKTSAGAPFKLPPDLMELVKSQVTLLKGSPGFGIRSVRAVASSVFAANIERLFPGSSASAAHPAPLTLTWTPSDDWCYRFLHENMGFKWRRITGKKVCSLFSLQV